MWRDPNLLRERAMVFVEGSGLVGRKVRFFQRGLDLFGCACQVFLEGSRLVSRGV